MPNLKIPIKYWEILNEPEMNELGLTFYKGTGQEYVEILKNSNESIKATCADCKIVQGGAAGIRPEMLSYWEKIFDFCLKNNRWIEINADPMRLDLPDYLVKDAVKYEVKLTLGTDAHHIDHMDNMIYGIYTARRGWAEPKNIVNTLTFEEFKKVLE